MLKIISDSALALAIDGRLIPGSAVRAARDAEGLVHHARDVAAAGISGHAAAVEQVESEARERGYRDGLQASLAATLSISHAMASLGQTITDRARQRARDDLALAMRHIGVEEAVVRAVLASVMTPVKTPPVLTLPADASFDVTRFMEVETGAVNVVHSSDAKRPMLDIDGAVFEFATCDLVAAATAGACELTETEKAWLTRLATKQRDAAVAFLAPRQRNVTGHAQEEN